MTLKQRDFIANYTNIDNPKTYSNATQSVKQSYGYSDDNSAAVMGNHLLSNSKVIDSIEQNIIDLGMESKVRLKAINEVINGTHRQETVTETTDKDGNTYTSKTLKAPRASDLVKAVDLIEKITGTYDKNKAKADVVSADLKDIMRRHRRELTGKQGGGKGSPA